MARGASGEPSSDSSSSRGDCCNNFFGSLWLKRFMCTVGLLTSLAIGFVSVFALIGAVINPLSIFFCAYQLIFAIMLILAELKLQFFMRWFLFLAPYVGLGLFYIFVAIFTVGNGKWWQILVAAICGAIGICYMFMGFAGQDRGMYDLFIHLFGKHCNIVYISCLTFAIWNVLSLS